MQMPYFRVFILRFTRVCNAWGKVKKPIFRDLLYVHSLFKIQHDRRSKKVYLGTIFEP